MNELLSNQVFVVLGPAMAGDVLLRRLRQLGKSDGGSAFSSSAGMRRSGIRGTPSSGSRSFFYRNPKLTTRNWPLTTGSW